MVGYIFRSNSYLSELVAEIKAHKSAQHAFLSIYETNAMLFIENRLLRREKTHPEDSVYIDYLKRQSGRMAKLLALSVLRRIESDSLIYEEKNGMHLFYDEKGNRIENLGGVIWKMMNWSWLTIVNQELDKMVQLFDFSSPADREYIEFLESLMAIYSDDPEIFERLGKKYKKEVKRQKRKEEDAKLYHKLVHDTQSSNYKDPLELINVGKEISPEFKKHFENCIARLDEKDRTLYLAKLLGLSQVAISKMQKVTEARISQRYKIAAEIIKNCMAEFMEMENGYVLGRVEA